MPIFLGPIKINSIQDGGMFTTGMVVVNRNDLDLNITNGDNSQNVGDAMVISKKQPPQVKTESISCKRS